MKIIRVIGSSKMKTFEHHVSDLPDSVKDWLKYYLKKPIPVKAIQINEPFRVKSLEGDYARGKPGDYLMVGVEGECYICDQDIFNKSYDKVKEE
jgi:hypothetical protein